MEPHFALAVRRGDLAQTFAQETPNAFTHDEVGEEPAFGER
jgi:hypothetical protein